MWPVPAISPGAAPARPPAPPWPSPPSPAPSAHRSGPACSTGTTRPSALPSTARCSPALVELVDHPERFGALWADEDAQLDADLAWIASGAVTVEEVPALDLSVVTLPEGPRSTGGHRFGSMWSERIHPLALHGAIDGFAVLVRQGEWCELRYRYESWVQYVSRPVRPRVDLSALAAELSAADPTGVPGSSRASAP